ncbi:unnamed protein product [Chironomus riparius]|uniref:Peptidase C1A papain C-terminal domain-containing protein n=1 Tax=Chironomus riparius TaxID=315576 RepID=A0A9N9S839_9DIPT|nr:unnamed protein product [Chironomus riparius]
MMNKNARNNNFEDYPDLPDARESVDYRKEGLVTKVGLQINCNSCYAWSSAAVLEGQLRKCGISRKSVSVQSEVDCTTASSWHCKSGYPYSVFRWQMKGGILPASKYPYEDKDGICAYSRNDVLAYVDVPYDYDFYNVHGGHEYMKKLVSHYGPIASGICSSKSFEDYSSGVYDVDKCCKKSNHAIAIVGYGTDPKNGDYWLVKNSWGPTWGDNGFGKIARGKNTCEFETEVYFAQVRDVNGKVCRVFS